MAAESLNSMLTALGGTRATTNAGDTGALRQLLAQLQGADYQSVLDSVFQQSAAKVPQIQTGLANALGARSGNNSAVATALMNLQKDTAIAGAQAVNQAQLQNQQIQQNAAGNIAQATRGTVQKSGTNLGQAATILAALSGLKKSGLLQDLGLTGQSSAPAPAASQPAPVFTVPPLNAGPLDVYGQQYEPAVSYAVPEVQLQPTDLMPQEFSPITFVPPEQSMLGQDNPNVDFNVPDELFLADGGLVQAGGSRRSANPRIQADPVQALQALVDSELLRTRQQNEQSPQSQQAQASSSSSSSGTVPATGGPGAGRLLSQAAAVNAISGLTGGPSLPNIGGFGLGTMANMASARSGSDAAMVGAQALASGLGSTTGSVFSAGKAIAENNASSLINALAALTPVTAVANLGSSLLGGPTAGSLLAGTPANIPQGSGPVTEATPGLLGMMGVTPGAGQLYSSGSSSGSSYATPYAVPSSTVVASGPESVDSMGTPMANGGEVRGPGTGTSDSVKARLSDGEYVVSADVVQKLGVDFFDLLQQQLHTPVRGGTR